MSEVDDLADLIRGFVIAQSEYDGLSVEDVDRLRAASLRHSSLSIVEHFEQDLLLWEAKSRLPIIEEIAARIRRWRLSMN